MTFRAELVRCPTSIKREIWVFSVFSSMRRIFFSASGALGSIASLTCFAVLFLFVPVIEFFFFSEFVGLSLTARKR